MSRESFCPREADVLDAVASLRWPHRADEELRQHVSGCAMCADTALVAGALHQDQDEIWQQAVVPAADIVWWRAQMRARVEASQAAARPVLAVQAIGVACALGAVAGLFGSIGWWFRSWLDWLSSAAVAIAAAPTPMGFDFVTIATRGLLLALAVWLVLAPVAVFLAATDD